MKEVTFRTDFPHAVKSQAQKQLRETHLCLEGGREWQRGRKGKVRHKRKRELPEKVFPKKWLGALHSRDSALVPVQVEWKVLCELQFSSGWYPPLHLTVLLLLSCVVPATTASKDHCLSLLPLTVCIPHLSSLRDGPFTLLLLQPLPMAAGSPFEHPWISRIYFLNPRRGSISFKHSQTYLFSDCFWGFCFKSWWFCLYIFPHCFLEDGYGCLCPVCPTLGEINSSLVPSLLPQVYAVHMAPYASLMVAGYKFMFSIPAPLSWSWMPSQCLATVPGPVESLICQFMPCCPMGRAQFSAAPHCTERSSLAGHGSVWWHCGPRRHH